MAPVFAAQELTEEGLSRTLAGLGEVAYVIDPEGVLIAYGRPQWDRFALTNDAPELARPGAVIGRSIFDSIVDAENRVAYEGYYDLLLSGVRKRIAFLYRCDGPNFGREMLMLLQPIRLSANRKAILHRSRTRAEMQSQALPFMKDAARQMAASELPLLKVCSYCQYVYRGESSGPDLWVMPSQYRREGGVNDVRLTHGICPACYEHVVGPQLDLLEPAGVSERSPVRASERVLKRRAAS